MVTREVVLPSSPAEVWDWLTEPDAVSTWFGAEVDWDLAPGGRVCFRDDDGTVRHGVIDLVEPERRLRFHWWPEGDPRGGVSEVNYDLEPADEGTHLVVTEEPAAPPASASAAAVSRADETMWTAWDERLLGIWSTSAVLFRCQSR